MKKTDAYWKKKLTPEKYAFLRKGDIETPFTGELLHHKEKGTYQCAGCGVDLFSSNTKFDSGTGWPSFYDVVDKGKVKLKEDLSYGVRRTEVLCANCGSHLGHLFDDGPKEKTGLRYCLNSACLAFKKGKV